METVLLAAGAVAVVEVAVGIAEVVLAAAVAQEVVEIGVHVAAVVDRGNR